MTQQIQDLTVSIMLIYIVNNYNLDWNFLMGFSGVFFHKYLLIRNISGKSEEIVQ